MQAEATLPAPAGEAAASAWTCSMDADVETAAQTALHAAADAVPLVVLGKAGGCVGISVLNATLKGFAKSTGLYDTRGMCLVPPCVAVTSCNEHVAGAASQNDDDSERAGWAAQVRPRL